MNIINGLSVLTLGAALALAGCGGGGNGGGGGGAPATTTLSGTAATGAAVANGSVTAKCSDGSGFSSAVTTNANGQWSGTLSQANALPCALQVSYGTPATTLYSVAYAPGTVNITPLTNLVVAKASAQLPSAWFTSGVTIAAATLGIAIDEFKAALVAQGYAIPATGNAFTTAFAADGTGWDKLLDQLKAAIPDYAAFVQGIANGTKAFTDIPKVAVTESGGGTPSQVLASFEGIAPSSNGNLAFDVPVSAGDKGWANNWSTIRAVDVSSQPLTVTPAGGEALSGGNTAVTFLGNENTLSKSFDGDVYTSMLVRVNQPTGKSLNAEQKLVIGNQAIYIGLEKADHRIVASIGDNSDEKVNLGNFDGNVTYHLVARLYKANGAAYYNRLDYWVDPARAASAAPDGTITRTTNNSGNLNAVSYLGLVTPGGANDLPVLVDRIVASSTWDGLFGDAASGGTGNGTGGNGGDTGAGTGDGVALNGLNGVTATVDGMSYTYTSTDSVYIYSATTNNSAILATDVNNGNPVHKWGINKLPNTVGTYNCSDTGTFIQLVRSDFFDQGGYTATECTIEVISVSGTEIEGRFSAPSLISPKAGVKPAKDLGAVTNGYFRSKNLP